MSQTYTDAITKTVSTANGAEYAYREQVPGRFRWRNRHEGRGFSRARPGAWSANMMADRRYTKEVQSRD
jgi:hypothetical protein